MSTKEYMVNLFKDPNIASITPTSKSCVRELCNKMNFDKRLVVIEYGPATGVFTNYLLERMTKDSLMIVIELNKNFVKYLNDNVRDDRLKIHHDSAEHVDEIMRQYTEQADYVISGIPFTFFKPELRKNIVQKTKGVLKAGGRFLPYQTFFQKDHHLKNYLVDHFSKVQDQYFFRNLPPMRLYEAVKEI
ncbi:class I SAM-dependent methyltransferase [Alkalihalobacillus deserti]|uniref:class I SAM-dependent methyltransferase n=1 Tax=Alkalihalobacillus deserti TaxID=2879466 RepID=UPI001D1520CA|nr:methyltransferase domain-containing protein [Alkalihalobacillus deserti]